MFLSPEYRGRISDSLCNAKARHFRKAERFNRSLLIAATLAAAIVLQVFPAALAQAEERPNIVVVLADDLGYGDIGCYGNQAVKTPNLDRFARSGVRLTNCYSASANCSPSRAGLMTGRTPVRVGIHNWIPMFSPMHVRRQEVTIATLLRNAGYATCQVGKWHLNGMFNDAAQPQPSDHGFDHWFSTQNNALPNHVNPDNFVRNGKAVGLLHGYSAGIVADEAIRWLRGGRKMGRPFFLFVCFHEPHEPIATAPQFSELYDYPEQPSRAAHHGNISQMDDAFGRLLQTLDDMHLSENTFVAFTSDNGPAITGRHPHGSAGPLRDKKGSMYEGGIRVPGMVRWPGKTKAGVVSDVPVSGVDFLPTLCKLAGAAKPTDRKLDGANFLPALHGQPILRKTPLYWQFNRAHGKPKVAMRKGDWKILATLDAPPLKPSGGITEEDRHVLKTAELTGFELYRLATDIAEAEDMTRAEPERLKQMSAELVALYHDVRQESPLWPVWEWPRYETSRIIWGP